MNMKKNIKKKKKKDENQENKRICLHLEKKT